jgi:Leucine-rich repeat (LRR) protein
MNSNKVKYLDSELLANVINLRNFSMSNNRLETLPTKFFMTNLKVEYVWLRFNQIKLLNSDLFNDNLKFLDLRANLCVNKLYESPNLADLEKDLTKNCSPRIKIKTERVEAIQVDEGAIKTQFLYFNTLN